MTEPDTASAILLSLESALKRLESFFGTVVDHQAVPILARRRRSVLVLRSALGTGDAGRAAPKPAVPGPLADIINAEWRLARRIGLVRAGLSDDHELEHLLATLQAEVEETALSLRLVGQRQDGR